MASWSEVEAAAPELAARARELFDAHVHKTLATVRRDGAPRISGTECRFERGQLWIGSMWQAMKALDLRRDPRFALHSGSQDPPAWDGDAKVAGRMVEETDPAVVVELNGEAAAQGPTHLFRADVTELVVVGLNPERTKLLVDSWHPGRGVRRRER
jgi:hypothetical protein